MISKTEILLCQSLKEKATKERMRPLMCRFRASLFFDLEVFTVKLVCWKLHLCDIWNAEE